MLSEQTIQNLRVILKEDCGQELTIQEASDLAYWLLDYVELSALIYNKK
jgi:hypothetical protein